jgi:amidase
MTTTATDLELALQVVAEPDEEQQGIGYRLSLPAPRHQKLTDFRVVVVVPIRSYRPATLSVP